MEPIQKVAADKLAPGDQFNYDTHGVVRIASVRQHRSTDGVALVTVTTTIGERITLLAEFTMLVQRAQEGDAEPPEVADSVVYATMEAMYPRRACGPGEYEHAYAVAQATIAALETEQARVSGGS